MKFFSHVVSFTLIVQLSLCTLYGMEPKKPTGAPWPEKIAQIGSNQSLWVTAGAHCAYFAAFKKVPKTVFCPLFSSLAIARVVRECSYLYLTTREQKHDTSSSYMSQHKKHHYPEQYPLTSKLGRKSFTHNFLVASTLIAGLSRLKKAFYPICALADFIGTSSLLHQTAHDFLYRRKIPHDSSFQCTNNVRCETKSTH